MATTSTPLRYPGGKSRLSRYLSHLLRYNRLSDCTYIEPFAGGAGAAINLLRFEYVRQVYLNDVDRGIYAFWDSVLNHTEALCGLIKNISLSIDEWQRQREIMKYPNKHSQLELGFAVLYLNRTNRSGIIKGGVIGGQEQTGLWKIDARFNRDGLSDKIRRIAVYRHRICLFHMDALDFLNNVVAECKSKTFIYLDPPYFCKGQALYENHYKHEDHVMLSKCLKNIDGKPWVVSYDNVAEVRKIYKGQTHLSYGINYSAAERYIGKEIMFFGPGVTKPPLKNPLGVKQYA